MHVTARIFKIATAISFLAIVPPSHIVSMPLATYVLINLFDFIREVKSNELTYQTFQSMPILLPILYLLISSICSKMSKWNLYCSLLSVFILAFICGLICVNIIYSGLLLPYLTAAVFLIIASITAVLLIKLLLKKPPHPSSGIS